MGYGDKTGKFLRGEERTCIKKHYRMKTASQAHRTTAAIQNACRRRNTGTSHSHNPLGPIAALIIENVAMCVYHIYIGGQLNISLQSDSPTRRNLD